MQLQAPRALCPEEMADGRDRKKGIGPGSGLWQGRGRASPEGHFPGMAAEWLNPGERSRKGLTRRRGE